MVDVFWVLFLLYFPPAFAVPSVLIRIVSQAGNSIGPEGAKAVADAMRAGAEDTTLHVRVPGKPVELIGLDCVTRGLPPEWPVVYNTPACVLLRLTPECAKDIDSFLFMHASAHVQFIFITTLLLYLLCLCISAPLSTFRHRFHVAAHHNNPSPRPMMPTFLREPAGIRREHHLSRGKPRIKLK